jgi:RNA polymerase sigma-70 factor (ECF subfamily)
MPAPKILAELEEHRPYLLKFAALQLRQRELAEDLVQEVFLSALKGADGFSGRSSVRTWLTSILLNKIADHHRKAGREVSMDALAEADGEDGIDALFRRNGYYANMPQAWRNPEDSLTDQRFYEALEACVARLSAAAGRAFLLRELMGFSVEEICKELQVSTSNCHVLLHRARLRLRACLEERWFATERRK